MKTKFYDFRQNNSGGYHMKDAEAGIGEVVIIEARDAEHAGERASDIFCYFRNYCSCCGDRWSDNSIDEDRAGDVPHYCHTPIKEYKAWFEEPEDAYIHYLDGTIEHVVLQPMTESEKAAEFKQMRENHEKFMQEHFREVALRNQDAIEKRELKNKKAEDGDV